MKKALALLLSLVMVLGMVTIASAAATAPKINVVIDTEDDMFATAANTPVKFYVHVDWIAGEDALGNPITLSNIDVNAIDDAGTTYGDFVTADDSVFEVGDNPTTLFVEGCNYGAETIWIQVDAEGSDGNDYFVSLAYDYEAPAAPVDPEIVRALDVAILSHADTAYINLSALEDPGVVYPVDWKYITNTWVDGKWYPNYDYLGLNLMFYWGQLYEIAKTTVIPVGIASGTTYTIFEGDLDYTWSKTVDFNETTGLVKYSKTEAEMYNIIRAITGDVKNPYVFGFCQYDDYGYSTVPTMTVSKVVPQQWLNYYSPHDLYLFAWDAGIHCDNWAHNEPKILAETTLDAVATTQRIDFVTSDLYKTLVLSKTADEAADPADEETDDANPNTGANDIVNVAIVFAVISLAAAGAFVFKKASK